MKKISLLIITVCLVFASCTDSFLETDPSTQLGGDKAYTAKTIESAMIAAYQPLQWMDMWMPIPFVAEVMGNDIRVGGSSLNDQAAIHDLSRYRAKATDHSDAIWRSAYRGIFRANIVITELPKITMDPTVKARLNAEAYALRTFYYYQVWRFYGNIPYFENNPTDIVNDWRNIKQYKVKDAYEKLIADINIALDGDKLPASSAAAGNGRFTQAAAQMVKAHLVLTQKDDTRYKEVITDMKSIIDSPNYGLIPEFADIWKDTGEWSEESIFEINYTDLNSTRGWGDDAFLPGGSVFPSMIGINGLSDNDPTFVGGWGFMPVEKALYDAYDDADQRKNSGILSFDYYKTHENLAASYQSDRWDDTGYFNKKYLPRRGENARALSSKEVNYRNNIRIFRTSDAYLIASELLLRTGGSQTDADTYLNDVRGRAYRYLGSYKITGVTLDNVLNERRLEFACEGHRFFDMIRFGKDAEITHQMQIGKDGNGLPTYGTFTYDPAKRYFPIPQSEVDRSLGALDQNIGY